LLGFRILWQAQRCPHVLVHYLKHAPYDSRQASPGDLLQAAARYESLQTSDAADDSPGSEQSANQQLDSQFQLRQEELVRRFALARLGNIRLLEGDSIWALEAETWREMGFMQALSPEPTMQSDKSSRMPFDQQLQVHGWSKFLSGLPSVSNIWLSYNKIHVHIDFAFWFKGAWYFFLARPSPKIKDTSIADAELSRWVAQNCGLPLGGMYLLHPRDGYVRRGELDDEAVVIDSLQHLLKYFKQGVGNLAPAILARTAEGTMPACGRRFCPVCNPHAQTVSPFSIHTLYKGGRAVQLLLEAGITDIRDIAQAAESIKKELSDKQLLQITAVTTTSTHLDRSALATFLEQLVFPLCFLDFECSSRALSAYEGTANWELVPFLFSWHRVDSLEDLLKFKTSAGKVSCARPGEDGRSFLAQELAEGPGLVSGSVIGYGTALEKNVLNRLSNNFPQYKTALRGLLDRLLDIQDPFVRFLYYHPEQKGKTSLKTTLPLLTGVSHKDLIMQSGGLAHLYWAFLSDAGELTGELQQRFTGNAVPQRITEICDYAAMDTLGLVHLLVALVRLSTQK